MPGAASARIESESLAERSAFKILSKSPYADAESRKLCDTNSDSIALIQNRGLQ